MTGSNPRLSGSSAAAATAVGEDEVHPLLQVAFRELEGLRWCLLRGRDRIAVPDGDVDLLIHPDDAHAARTALSGAGFVMLRRWAGGSQNFFLAYHRRSDRWIYLHAVTELDFGPMHALRMHGFAPAVLERRVMRRGVPMPVADDGFWITLLHALLDKGRVAAKHRNALARGATGVRIGGFGGQWVDALGVEGAGAAELLEAARSGDWARLEAAAAPISAAWRRRDRVAAVRARVHAASLLAAKIREIVTRRGVATAIVAPDGAGKSTVIDSLADALFFKVMTYYLGLESGFTAGGPRSRVPGIGLVRRAARVWSIYLRSRLDLSRRRLVLFDRYPYEAFLPPPVPYRPLSMLRRRLMGHLLPPPHLVVVLDAPGEVLYVRKQEHSVERLERDRQAYLSLAKQRPRWTVVDATRPAVEVRRDVTAAIWRAYRRRFRDR